MPPLPCAPVSYTRMVMLTKQRKCEKTFINTGGELVLEQVAVVIKVDVDVSSGELLDQVRHLTELF